MNALNVARLISELSHMGVHKAGHSACGAEVVRTSSNSPVFLIIDVRK